ncbi:MAG: ankyrin repeat domain-containing protein [Gemmatimonadaceae bacterium]
MDTLPLPRRPDLAQYKKRAKELVIAARSADLNAVRAWAEAWLRALASALGTPITPFVEDSMHRAIDRVERRVRDTATERELSLADAQFLIASAHSFETWAAFVRHVEGLTRSDRETSNFEKAADAIVDGDLPMLEALVREHPELIRARSEREHHVTLLHYIAANGVEDFRQKTPPNAVAIARFLLEHGAEVDAGADTYGGNVWQTPMNLLVSSAHPDGAGLQAALAEVLLDFGAAVNGVANDESPIMTALDFGYGDTAETLERRGARVDNVVLAAALGRIDLVRHYVIDANTLAPNLPLIAPHWRHMPNDATVHLELALAWACKFARVDVANILLDRGVDPASADGYKMTALHWAAANGCTDLVKRLIAAKVPLEVENVWQGTVLDSTAHFAMHMPVEGADYGAIFQLLIDAGADVSVLAPYPAGNKPLDDVRRRHRVPIPAALQC